MKVKRAVIGTLAVFLVVFGFYLYKLHALSVEGNKIFEQRCLVVNPSLIAYKNSFLKFADAVKYPDKYTVEQGRAFYDGYINGMREYEPRENNWIADQKAFVSRLDFKLIEPWYIKEAGDYQIKMYEGYRDEAKASVDVVDGRITMEEYNSRFDDARERRNKYTALYNGAFDKGSGTPDWRKIFSYVPMASGCNDENMVIPDTTGALNPTPPPVKKPEITG